MVVAVTCVFVAVTCVFVAVSVAAVDERTYIHTCVELRFPDLYHVSIANLMFLDSSLRGSMFNVQVGLCVSK